MTFWFAGLCLVIVIIAIIAIRKAGPSIENQPRHILTAMLSMIGFILVVYLILSLMLIQSC